MKSLLIFFAIFLGLIFSESNSYSFLIKYIIMVMLFFSFLEEDFLAHKYLYLEALKVFLLMVIVALFFYAIINLYWDQELALIAFLVAITPTATGAPVVMSLTRKNVSYVTTSIILTTFLASLLLSFLLPLITQSSAKISTGGILFSTLIIVVIPLGLCQLLKKFSAGTVDFLRQWRWLSFYFWLLVLYLATSKTVFYLRNQASSPIGRIVQIALISLTICIVNFTLGRILGGARYSWETSQSLGQKNTMFMVWIGLQFLSPITALGPMFYVLYQNLYNSYLISSYQKNSSRSRGL